MHHDLGITLEDPRNDKDFDRRQHAASGDWLLVKCIDRNSLLVSKVAMGVNGCKWIFLALWVGIG